MIRLTRFTTYDDYYDYVKDLKNLGEEPKIDEFEYIDKNPYQLVETAKKKEITNTLAYFENIQEELGIFISDFFEALKCGIIYDGYHYIRLQPFLKGKKWFIKIYDGYLDYVDTVPLEEINKTWFIANFSNMELLDCTIDEFTGEVKKRQN